MASHGARLPPSTRPEGPEELPPEVLPQEIMPLASDRGTPSTTVLLGAENAPASASGTAPVRRRPRKRRRKASTSRVSTQSSNTPREAPTPRGALLTLPDEAPTPREVVPPLSHTPDPQPYAMTERSPPTTRRIGEAGAAMQPLDHRSQQPSDEQAPAPASPLPAATETRTPVTELVTGEHAGASETVPTVPVAESATATRGFKESPLLSAARENTALHSEIRQNEWMSGVVGNLAISKGGSTAAEAVRMKAAREAALSETWLSAANATGSRVAQTAQDTWRGLQRWAQFRHLPTADVKVSAPPPTMRKWNSAKVAILASALATVAIIVAVILISWLQPPDNGTRSDRKPVCSTVDCVHHAHIMRINLSQETAPCDDFGRFVCSGWTSKHRNLVFTVRGQAIVDWILEIRKNSLRAAETATVLDTPLRMMRECVDRENSNEHGDHVQEFLNFVNGRIFAWPTHDWDEEEMIPPWRPLRALIELAVLWGLPLWFRVEFLPKLPEPRRVRVVISPSPLAMIFRRIQQEVMLTEDLYSYYVDRFIDSIFSERPCARAYETFLWGSSKMQSDVFGKISSASESPHFVPKVVTIHGLTSVTSISAENWTLALESVDGTPLMSQSRLLITNELLLQAMNAIFRAYTAREVWFHTSWWLVQIMGPAASDELFNEAVSHPLGRTCHSMLCAFHVEASYGALLTAFYMTRLPTAEQQVINRVMRSIERILLEKVGSSSRFNRVTRSALEGMINKTRTAFWPGEHLESIEDLEKFYGPPYNISGSFFSGWLRSRELLQRNLGTPEYAEATSMYRLDTMRFSWYNAALSLISMSLALLAPPFYYAGGTSAMLYAGLGYMYAEELLYALNTMLCLLKDGELLPRVNSDTRRALWKTPCPIWCPYVKDSHLLFPGLQALDIAYTAYVRFRDKTSDFPLKDLEIYSADQLFFITACHAGCGMDRTGIVSNHVCAVALKKFAPFMSAFSCTQSSDMDAFEMCHYI